MRRTDVRGAGGPSPRILLHRELPAGGSRRRSPWLNRVPKLCCPLRVLVASLPDVAPDAFFTSAVDSPSVSVSSSSSSSAQSETFGDAFFTSSRVAVPEEAGGPAALLPRLARGRSASVLSGRACPRLHVPASPWELPKRLLPKRPLPKRLLPKRLSPSPMPPYERIERSGTADPRLHRSSVSARLGSRGGRSSG